MAYDHAPALIANPANFIANHSIALSEIAVNLGVAGLLVNNNMRCRLTLSQSTWFFGATYAPSSMPMLRMLPGMFAVGLTAFDSYYCHAGAGVGGWGVNALPYQPVV